MTDFQPQFNQLATDVQNSSAQGVQLLQSLHSTESEINEAEQGLKAIERDVSKMEQQLIDAIDSIVIETISREQP